MGKQTPRLAYTFAEVCEALGLGKSWLYETVNRGELRSFKIGRRRMVSAAALQEFIHDLEHGPTQKPGIRVRASCQKRP
jgi:excisionase family DNA binding protein